jgi:hypothetical protein
VVVEVLQEHDLAEGALFVLCVESSVCFIGQIGSVQTTKEAALVVPPPSHTNTHLRVRRVLEGVKDLLQRHRVLTLAVDGLPDDAVGLRGCRVCVCVCVVQSPSCRCTHTKNTRAPPPNTHPLAQLLQDLVFAQHMLVDLLLRHGSRHGASVPRPLHGERFAASAPLCKKKKKALCCRLTALLLIGIVARCSRCVRMKVLRCASAIFRGLFLWCGVRLCGKVTSIRSLLRRASFLMV